MTGDEAVARLNAAPVGRPDAGPAGWLPHQLRYAFWLCQFVRHVLNV